MIFVTAADARRKAPHDLELISALERHPSLGWIDEPYQDPETGELNCPMRLVPHGVTSTVLARIERLGGGGRSAPPAAARAAAGACPAAPAGGPIRPLTLPSQSTRPLY